MTSMTREAMGRHACAARWATCAAAAAFSAHLPKLRASASASVSSLLRPASFAKTAACIVLKYLGTEVEH